MIGRCPLGAFWGGCALGIGGLALYLCLLTECRPPLNTTYLSIIANQLSPRIPFYYSILLLWNLYRCDQSVRPGRTPHSSGSPGFGSYHHRYIRRLLLASGFSKLMGWIYLAMGYVGLL